MKGGKTACMDSVIVEMLENRGISIIDWLLKYFRDVWSLVLYQRIGASMYSPDLQKKTKKNRI